MKSFSKTTTLAFVSLTLLLSCGKRHVRPMASQEFDKDVDARIISEIQKRKDLVQGNTVFESLVARFEEGRAHLLNQRAKEAYFIFDEILSSDRFKNYPEYRFAKYYLSIALYDMDVPYGSLLYFVDIVEKEPLQAHTHESLRRAIKIAQELKDDELIVYLAEKISQKKVPLSLREEFRYFIAKNLYLRGQHQRAMRLLSAISFRNRLYLGAQYLMGTIAMENQNFDLAIEHFQKISNTRSPVEYYEKARLSQIANLAIGRIFYERGNYPLAVLYYGKVQRDGEFFPPALYESSWALFKLNKFNETLSILHSLNSPFFEQVFFIKSYLLKAATYMEVCYYDKAVQTLSELEKSFLTLGEQIDTLAKAAKDPRNYYPILKSTEQSTKGEKTYKYRELFNLAAGDKDFLNLHRYIEELQSEQTWLRKLENKRATILSGLLQQRIDSLSAKGSWIAGNKLKNTKEMILEYLALKDVLEYEIVSVERQVLQKRILNLAPPVLTDKELIQPEFTDSLKETMLWWEVRGDETWADEIGYFLYDLPSKCNEDQQAKER
ncbi:MAG: tetratricopeptide repeat protein [Bdellovibrionales bacterium]|nr:tetratricopeptide repeat protein [Bdellovibrionales bacterium]